MKNFIKNGLVAVMILFNLNSMNAFAVNRITVEINIGLDSIKSGSRITIKDSKNKIVFNEMVPNSIVEEDGYQLPNLGQGNYILEIEYDIEILIKPFKVEERSVVFLKDKAYTIYKPHLKVSDKQVHLTRLNLAKEEIIVKVYDQYGELLHKEKFTDQLEMKRIYDFSNLNEDKFSVILESNSRTFKNTITFQH